MAFPSFVLRNGIFFFFLCPNSFRGSSNALQLNPEHPCQKQDRHFFGVVCLLEHMAQLQKSQAPATTLYNTYWIFFKSQGLEKTRVMYTCAQNIMKIWKRHDTCYSNDFSQICSSTALPIGLWGDGSVDKVLALKM